MIQRNVALVREPIGDPGSIAEHRIQVALRGVTRIYESSDGPPVHALGPLDFDLFKGEVFSVVGPSGCGKSTLLDLIAGLSPATAGEIMFEKEPVRGKVPEGIGLVFQEDASLPWLNVWDNVAFGLRRWGVDVGETRRRVDDALKLTGLTEFARAYPAQLSGGMRQRTCIARTLVLRPRLILLDEPFGALDQQTRLLMGDEVLKLWRATGSTIFLITHALDEAAMLSDRVGVMSARPGKFLEIVRTGWPRDRDSRIATHDAFGKVTSHLWSLLREESVRALGIDAGVR
jgi:NitT/TauT family transport system ATP-binding protein